MLRDRRRARTTGNVRLGDLVRTNRGRKIGEAHRAFDAVWKEGLTDRAGAYRWLARMLDLPPHGAHFGLFTIEQCEQVLDRLDHWRKILERRRDRRTAKAEGIHV